MSTAKRNRRRRAWPWMATVAALSSGLFVFLTVINYLNNFHAQEVSPGVVERVTNPSAFWFQTGVAFFICLSIFLVGLLFMKSTILDRYVLRSFLVPFTMCFIGLFAIWLIIDLSDNLPDFLKAADMRTSEKLSFVLSFYLIQLPGMVVMILPISILLALLYTLGKMSRANEIISMLGVGLSVTRILTPLFAFGVVASLVCLLLNYQLAPQTEGHTESMLKKISGGYKEKTAKVNHFYPNIEQSRFWFIGQIPYDLERKKFRDVQIRQMNEQGDISKTYFAASAYFFKIAKMWRLYRGVQIDFDEEGIPVSRQPFEKLDIMGWNETPWRIASSGLNPEFLGVPELTDYLNTNSNLLPPKLAPFRTHLSSRWALPWNCLVIVLFAAPLGIVYSRRGVLAGVASSIFIFFAMFFLNSLFSSLGQGSRMPPFAAAWATNILFGLIGLNLLFLRARNREAYNPLALLKDLFRRTPAAEAQTRT